MDSKRGLKLRMGPLRLGGRAVRVEDETEMKDAWMVDDGTMQRHVRTYAGLIGVMKWGGMAVAAIAIMVIWLIAR